MSKDLKRDRSLFFRVTEQEQVEFKADADKRRMEQTEFFRYIWQAFRDSLTKKSK